MRDHHAGTEMTVKAPHATAIVVVFGVQKHCVIGDVAGQLTAIGAAG